MQSPHGIRNILCQAFFSVNASSLKELIVEQGNGVL
jgi:hypothetical protein